MKKKIITHPKICKDNIKAYKRLELLGSGSYGLVFKAQHMKDKKIVAIKKMKKKSNKEGLCSSFIRQISILRRLKHQNIVQLLDISVNENEEFGFLVMEYMPTDLEKELKRRKNLDFVPSNIENFKENLKSDTINKSNLFIKRGFSLKQTKFIIKEILKAIKYCHEQNIFHRDLKPANVLYDQHKGLIKIADFGIAKQFYLNPKENTQVVSSLFYRAPQVLWGGNHYGKQIDIWAIGCIFGQCLTGNILFQSKDVTPLGQSMHILKKLGIFINQTDINYEFGKVSLETSFTNIKQKCISQNMPLLELLLEKYNEKEEALDLMNKMLQLNTKNRITAAQALKHPFFKSSKQQNPQQSFPFESLKLLESRITTFQ